MRTYPHTDATAKFNDWAGEGAAFAEWKTANGAVDWDLASKQLENPTFRYHENKTTGPG